MIILSYYLLMRKYFSLKEKKASKKYYSECLIVIVAIFISLFVKGFLIFLDINLVYTNGLDVIYSVFEIIARILSSLYSVIGGLQFEGLAYEIGDTIIANSIVAYLYFGSSLLAGAIVLSVITATISYEIYSKIKLRYFIKKNSRIDFFIFTSLTEDALILAKDIKRSCEERGRKYLVIFSSDMLDSFDSKNELCREVVACSFLYYSLFKEQKNIHSLLERLNIYSPNINCICGEKIKNVTYTCQTHIFSLKLDENLVPAESDNSSSMFNEVSIETARILKNISKTNKLVDLFDKKYDELDSKFFSAKAMIIDLYVLTARSINYEFYQSNLEQIIVDEFLKIDNTINVKELKKSNLFKMMKSCFQFHLINEALISSKTFTLKRHELLNGELMKSAKFTDDSIYRSMILGFGATGQAVMNAAYLDSTYVKYENKKIISSQFVANIFDERVNEYSGIFSLSHPLFMYKNCNSSLNIPDIEEIKKENYSRFSKIYGSLKDVNLNNDFYNEMKFPCISFHKCSCTDISFIKLLDESTGTSLKTSKGLFNYNLFIFAMGSDEKNISMANALIDDIKQELSKMNNNEYIINQSLAINIRDERNYYRVNWTEEDNEKYPSIKIIKFGNRNDIYSYDQIIDEKSGIIYYYGYSNFSSHENFQNIRDVLNINDDEESGNYYDYLYEMTNTDSFKHFEARAKRKKEWLLVPMYDKESNFSANMFAQNIREYAEEMIKDRCITSKELRILAYYEHQRWCRFYIANAWIYMNEKDKKNRHHNCICPFDNIPVDGPGQENNKAYDIVNVALALMRNK